MKHMKKIADWVFVLCFGAALVTVLVLTVQRKDETTSYYENRTLAAQPECTRESLMDGSYFSQWDAFWLDRAWGRSEALEFDTLWQWKVLHKPVVHNIVMAEPYLLSFRADGKSGNAPDHKEACAKTGAELLALKEQIEDYGGRLFYVGVPSQMTYYQDCYPDFLDNGQEDLSKLRRAFAQTLEKHDIPYVDMIEEFERIGRPKEYYYQSDHHYSFDGAFYTYQCAMERINRETGLELNVLGEEDIRRVTAPNSFLGSRNRQLYGMVPTEDRLVYAQLVEEIPFTRQNNGVPMPPETVKIPPADEPIGYPAYMEGDIAEIILDTDRPELPSVLVVGESYTNALEGLFYASFDEMRSLDLRYYHKKSLSDYLADYQPDIVIIVRDENQFEAPLTYEN